MSDIKAKAFFETYTQNGRRYGNFQAQLDQEITNKDVVVVLPKIDNHHGHKAVVLRPNGWDGSGARIMHYSQNSVDLTALGVKVGDGPTFGLRNPDGNVSGDIFLAVGVRKNPYV